MQMHRALFLGRLLLECGGSAQSDYQAAGFLGYKISRKCVFLGGFRYLSVNYRPNGKAQFVHDVNMPGLMRQTPGGLNGSTQHSVRTQFTMKTKAEIGRYG